MVAVLEIKERRNRAMNKEDYVSLEAVRLLKEKGFNEPCLYYISSNTSQIFYKGLLEIFKKEGHISFPCPTLYDVQKWLRENHNIHLDVRCTAYCKPLNRHDYMCEVFALSCSIFSDTKVYHKYEEALNAGILAALELI